MDSFNYVTATVHCPTCGETVDQLQTTDATIEPLRFETVPLAAIRTFYGQCDRCDTWLDFERRPDAAGAHPSDFMLTWDPHRKRLLSRRRFFTRFLGR